MFCLRDTASPRVFRARLPGEGFPRLVLGKRVFGSLRLPDVKPPCSNLAGLCSGHFLSALLEIRISAPRPRGEYGANCVENGGGRACVALFELQSANGTADYPNAAPVCPVLACRHRLSASVRARNLRVAVAIGRFGRHQASGRSTMLTRTASSGSLAIGEMQSSPSRLGPTTPPSKKQPS